MKRTTTPTKRQEAMSAGRPGSAVLDHESPHLLGWLAYVVEDKARTDHAVRLLRWGILAGALTLTILAAGVVLTAAVSPLAIGGLFGVGTTATAVGLGFRARRRASGTVRKGTISST